MFFFIVHTQSIKWHLYRCSRELVATDVQIQLHCSLHTQLSIFFFFFAGRPNLFAICNNTFSKWWEELRMTCRRVLSSTPLLVRGSETV
jgi:hypothetical protein